MPAITLFVCRLALRDRDILLAYREKLSAALSATAIHLFTFGWMVYNCCGAYVMGSASSAEGKCIGRKGKVGFCSFMSRATQAWFAET